MKNTVVMGFIIFISIRSNAQHKIIFRPSFGLANQSSQKGIINQNDLANNTFINFNKSNSFFEKWFPPQFGLMLVYQHNKHHTIGVGLSEGAYRFNLNTFKFNPISNDLISIGSTSMFESFQKWGFEYAYNFKIPDTKKDYNEITNRFSFAIMMAINRGSVDNSAGGFRGISTSGSLIDSVIVTTDSLSTSTILLNRNIIMLTPSFRVAYKNAKNKERLSITIAYDIGLQNIITYKVDGYYDMLQKNYKASQTLNGNQWKVYLSMPLTMYSFGK